MSDARLRALERTWRESGRSADEQAWLAARLRAGELDPQRLALAAWLGHLPAQAPSGVKPPSLPAAWRDVWSPPLRLWACGLARHGAAIALRVALTACRAVQASWAGALPSAADQLEEAIVPLERHLLDGAPPDPLRAEQLAMTVVMEDFPYALFLCAELVQALEQGGPRTWGPEWSAWSRITGPLVPLADQNELLDAAGVTVLTSWLLVRPAPFGRQAEPGFTLLAVLAHAAQVLGTEPLHTALGAALIPWALGRPTL